MTTRRDCQSARITKKRVKDVQNVYSAQTQQKGINKMASHNSKTPADVATNRDALGYC